MGISKDDNRVRHPPSNKDIPGRKLKHYWHRLYFLHTQAAEKSQPESTEMTEQLPFWLKKQSCPQPKVR